MTNKTETNVFYLESKRVFFLYLRRKDRSDFDVSFRVRKPTRLGPSLTKRFVFGESSEKISKLSTDRIMTKTKV